MVCPAGWSCLLLVAGLAAQRPEARAPLPIVVIGNHNLDGGTLAARSELPPATGGRELALRRTDGTVLRDHALLDPATRERLRITAGALRLESLDGDARWSVAAVPGAAFGDGALDRAVFARQRVVLCGGDGGLVALDRADGRVAWRRPAGPNELVVADGELVVAAGAAATGGAMHGHALQNGAAAFAVALPEAPQGIALGERGIAVRSAQHTVVFDRSGPRLCDLPAPASDVVALRDGWLVVVDPFVVSCDRTGRERWRRERTPGFMDQYVAVETADGSIVVARYCRMADSGVDVVCLDGANGDVRWRRHVDGLGVAHSKYWHLAQLFGSGDRLVVTSQAAGGLFAVALDPADGGQSARAEFRR